MNNKICIKKKYIRLFFITLIGCFFLIFLLKNINNYAYKGRAQTSNAYIFTVCPQNRPKSKDCNYVGGDGLQKAIDDASIGTAFTKTYINIGPGVYSRKNDDNNCNFTIKGKNLVIIGENNSLITSDYYKSLFCFDNANVEIRNLSLSSSHNLRLIYLDNKSKLALKGSVLTGSQIQILADNNSSVNIISNKFTGASYCSIFIDSNNTLNYITSNTISNNNNGICFNGFSWYYTTLNNISDNKLGLYISIFQSKKSTIEFKNNLVANNQMGIYVRLWDKVNILNNVFWKNSGLSIKTHFMDNDGLTIGNNIFAKNIKGKDDPSDNFIIYYDEGGYMSIKFFNNLFWKNETQIVNEGFYTNEKDEYITIKDINNISGQDPLFFDENNLNFHLLENSPAINNGSANIMDFDGTISDMGIFGGPIPMFRSPELLPLSGFFGGYCSQTTTCSIPYECKYKEKNDVSGVCI